MRLELDATLSLNESCIPSSVKGTDSSPERMSMQSPVSWNDDYYICGQTGLCPTASAIDCLSSVIPFTPKDGKIKLALNQ